LGGNTIMKRSGTSALLTGLLVVAGLLAVGHYWLRTSANPYWNAEQSRLRIEKTLRAEVLQSWATNLLQQYSGETNLGGYFSVHTTLPDGLDNIWLHRRPDVILREGVDGGERYVCLSWGSAMLGRWGLAIGSPSFVLSQESGPPADMPPKVWKPGVYFYQHYH